MKRIIGLTRDEVFSPNSVNADRMILIELLSHFPNHEVELIPEQALSDKHQADIYLSMARRETTLNLLQKMQDKGSLVINNSQSVRNCVRKELEILMHAHEIPTPPQNGDNGYWLKRSDSSVTNAGDIVFCKNKNELNKSIKRFNQIGINDYVSSSHVVGDLVKFYGVSDRFFSYFYPTDDGISKFGHEKINGRAQHYPFDLSSLKATVYRLASILGISFYGGDCIIDSEGRYYIIDFNDWPSFARCRKEAAAHMAAYVKSLY